MFDFHWPWMGLLILLPLLARSYWRLPPHAEDPTQEVGQRVTLLHPHLEQLRQSFQIQDHGHNLASRLYPLLLWTLWTALTVAMMRPQWLTPYSEVQSPGYDLMLAVDASHSMEAMDFSVQGQQVTRMQVLKGVLDRFIKGRDGDRIGLIIFGSQAFILSPLTIDREAVRQLLDGLMPNVAGEGTSLGDAIALATKKLRERPEASRVMILMTDGDNTNGIFPPLEAAKVAARAGVRIYAIGVGSGDKNIPIYEAGKIRYRDDLTMNENTLKLVASISRGAYFRATDTGALEEIYKQINELEKTKAETRTAFLPTPLYRWPLGLALLVLLALGIFPEGRRRFISRQPSRN